MFPSIMSLKVSLFIDGRLKYFIENDRTFHVTAFSGSCIAPYAQDDVIQTVLGGIYPGFVGIINYRRQYYIPTAVSPTFV